MVEDEPSAVWLLVVQVSGKQALPFSTFPMAWIRGQMKASRLENLVPSEPGSNILFLSVEPSLRPTLFLLTVPSNCQILSHCCHMM